MPVIIPSEDFSDISKLFDMTQKIQESIFITQNGYSDLVVMSSNYMKICKKQPNRPGNLRI
ncbi:prevent-host-death family protein [Enterococcus cecorum]|nr:prevent-host-death family protein [Enterococcus cecorum]